MEPPFGTPEGDEWAEIFQHGCLEGLDLGNHYLLEHDTIADEMPGGHQNASGPFGEMGTPLWQDLDPGHVRNQLTPGWPTAQGPINNDYGQLHCDGGLVGAGDFQYAGVLPGHEEVQPLKPPELFSDMSTPRTNPPIQSSMIANVQRRNPRFEGDLYTALWVRGEGIERAGWCGFCSSWHKMKDSAYWYHLHYTHGIAYATGKPIDGPRETQWVDFFGWNVMCGGCHKWLSIGVGDKARTCYFRHAHKCFGKARGNKSPPRSGTQAKV